MVENHRKLVRDMLAGKKPDRPLCDLGGRVASLSTPAYRRLKAHLGLGRELTGETVTLLNTIGQFDERILCRFDIPFRRIYLHPPTSFIHPSPADTTFEDEWGVTYHVMGDYNERVGNPLADAEISDLDSYPWPDPHAPGRIDRLADEAKRLYEETDFCLVAGHISAGIFQDCWNLRGMARFLEDMVLNRAFAEALLDRVTAVHIGLWEVFLSAVGPYIDLVETADDLGSQRGPLISPRMYRDLIKPRHAALNTAIRARTRAAILFHSCGAILPLIDDLIEIGVNVLNPIQPIPGFMEPELLRARYADRLVFHGGLDVQRLLPDGTPHQVRRHVVRYYEAFGTDRYIMAPANTVQSGTPPENIEAAFDAVKTLSS